MDVYPGRLTLRARAVVAATAALAVAFAGVTLLPPFDFAQAGPASSPATTTISATGPYSGTVPSGVCTVTATVLGASGGSAISTTSNSNGAGARVTATYAVVPGETYSGTVGGGGGTPSGSNNGSTQGPGGSNGGAAGGFSGLTGSVRHHGAGGGGYTDLQLGGTLAVLAGGGGGGGGGHSTSTDGTGGNAGLPTATGVTNGSNGFTGKDEPSATVNGGRGGTASAGAGGTNSAGSSVNGVNGSGRNGGAGGADPNPDAGGGGGGGYTGGGGGASTHGYNTQNGSNGLTGGGGGGGSSYVAPTIPLGASTTSPTGIGSSAGAKLAGAGNGANGSVTLQWNTCAYDLAVDKTVSPVNAPINSPVTWTVSITNLGPSAMTRGDTVTLTDTLPGAGAKTIQSIATSGGSNAILARGAVTCTAAVGAAMPASLDCSRPYQVGAGAASGTRGLDVNETLTITYSQVLTEANGTSLTNTATVTDRPSTPGNNTDTATTTVVAPPVAVNDSNLGNALGTVVNVSVKNNDSGTLANGSVVLWDTAGSVAISSPYVVAGQGTWTVAADVVTFTPLASFKGDPTPVTYRVSATNGLHATATVTITYLPAAVNDVVNGVAIGAITTIHPLANDDGDFVGSSLRLINPTTLLPVTGPVVVAGQGTWTISGTDVVFTPQAGFMTDPSPIGYQITDTTGDVVSATITITSVPSATNDSNLGNAIGSTVNLSVLDNDTGSWDTSSLVFASNAGTSLVVAGQGTWTVQPGGVVRFVPLGTFKGDPTPVTYRITDTTGDSVTALVTVTYVPSASNDSSLGNVLGSDVSVTVLSNDDGDFVSGSVRLMNGPVPVTSLVVTGEGEWTIVGDTVAFSPEAGFLVDPTPVTYRVTDTTGDHATATVTITYLPQAANDNAGPLAIGAVASVSVLANDTGSWNNSTLRLIDPSSNLSVTGPVVVAGEGTWTISGTSVVFTPLPTFLLDPTPMGYRITDTTGDTVSATVSVDYGPVAVDDSSLGNVLGSVVSLTVLSNDTGDFDTTTLGFGPGNVGVGATHFVAGQGTWEVTGAGIIAFTPLGSFLVDPTPVTYQVKDTLGDSASALMTITYLPEAADDSDLDNAFGTDVNVDVLANDTGVFTAGTVRILDGATPVMTLVVAGQGSWIVEADDTVTFHPEVGFLVDPSPVSYRVTDTTGDDVSAQITVTYLPQAVDDAQGGLAIGSVATVSVLDNDHGDWVNSSLRLIDPTTLLPVTGPVVVTGQGTWTISGTNVVFTPQGGFLVDPDPISYRITDTTGDDATAQVELDYGPGAADDEDLDNVLGTAVDVSVFDNDSGLFDNDTLGFGAGTGPGTTLVVADEGTWSVRAGGIIRFTPLSTFLVDPTPVTYYADDVTGDPVSALITITYLPEAADDSDLGNAFGTTVNVDVLANDTGVFTAGTVHLLDGTTPVTVLAVAGEGTWTVQGDDSISFVPLGSFLVDPTPVTYRVTDVTGDTVSALLTVTYLPEAVDDARTGIAIGSAITVQVLANDHGDFVTSSVRLIDPVTSAVAAGPVTVSGQGTWSLGAAGAIVFTPQSGFQVDPDPIDYRVTDTTGDNTSATITLNYVPAAANDSDLGNTLGTFVDLDVFANDTGDFDTDTLGFGPGNIGIGATLVVAGQGTWEVRAAGIIRFTPLGTFLGDPTPVRYYADDVTGDPVDALMTITYVPAASDDSDLDNVMGTDVNVDVLANDTGVFTPGTVRLMDGLLSVLTLTVAGEGVWTVELDDTITFNPDAGFLVDPTPATYRVTDTTGDYATATVTVTYLPEASDNSSTGNAAGTTVNVNVLGNDAGTWVANSVRILDGATPVTELTVTGEGLWRANSDGTITFFPEAGFYGDPAAITYRVTDVTGDSVSALLTITYVPVALLNRSNGNVIGSPVTVDPLGNDTGTFDETSVRLIDPDTLLPVTTLVVVGEGTWVVDTATGEVTFTPETGFMGNPSPVTYQVTDVTGDVVQSTITVNYLPEAVDDESLGNPAGSTVAVSVLPNDMGALVTGSARLLPSGAPAMSMVVPGEGTWTVDSTVASVSFAPSAGFHGNPTPVPYRVADVNGNLATADVTITYLSASGLALTGMDSQVPLMGAIGSILLGFAALVIARMRRITARHRA